MIKSLLLTVLFYVSSYDTDTVKNVKSVYLSYLFSSSTPVSLNHRCCQYIEVRRRGRNLIIDYMYHNNVFIGFGVNIFSISDYMTGRRRNLRWNDYLNLVLICNI